MVSAEEITRVVHRYLDLVATGTAGATGLGVARLRVSKPVHAEPWHT